MTLSKSGTRVLQLAGRGLMELKRVEEESQAEGIELLGFIVK